MKRSHVQYTISGSLATTVKPNTRSVIYLWGVCIMLRIQKATEKKPPPRFDQIFGHFSRLWCCSYFRFVNVFHYFQGSPTPLHTFHLWIFRCSSRFTFLCLYYSATDSAVAVSACPFFFLLSTVFDGSSRRSYCFRAAIKVAAYICRELA